MGDTRMRDPFCQPCLARYQVANWRYERNPGLTRPLGWKAVEPLAVTAGGGVRMRCKQCGHEYLTYSKAARRAARRLGEDA